MCYESLKKIVEQI